MSESTQEYVAQVKGAASAFVAELQTTRRLPVHISIELFAGDESSTVWQSHFLETETMLGKIAKVEKYDAPGPL